MGPRLVALATHCNEWVELHRSVWVGLVVVVAEMRPPNAMLCLQKERERERGKI